MPIGQYKDWNECKADGKSDEYCGYLEHHAKGKENRRKAIELYNDNQFTITEESDGTHIRGMLAYPGISRNGKFYSIEQLLAGHDQDLPMWLNHATTIGIEGIGDDLLPPSYRERLYNEEVIIVGREHLIFDPDKLQLQYEGVVTDPFYKNPEILKRMSVSQGVLHDRDLESECDAVSCWKKITGSVYQEMSLVFRPGFSIATLSVEADTIENNNAYNLSNLLKRYMSDTENSQSKENKPCGCNDKSTEGVDQAGGVIPNQAQCPEGHVWVRDGDGGSCQPINEAGNAKSNPGSKGVSSVAGHEAIDKAEAEVKKAQETAEKASADLKSATEALMKANEISTEDPEEMKLEKKNKDAKANKEEKGSEENTEWRPNADDRSRAKSQEVYNKKLQAHYEAIKSAEVANKAFVTTVMTMAKENAKRYAAVNTNTALAGKKKSIEGATSSVKAWADAIIKGDENVPDHKIWKLNDEYTDTFTVKKFKSTEGAFFFEKYTNYSDHMKSIEATDVNVTPGTATGDSNNFQRTLSELVLVYPDGRIITPIQQFCETAILAPGKKQHIFYETNVGTFAKTDEAEMDAGGSGFALQPSTITIQAAGGSLSPIGTLSRIGFTQLEELPIDIIQKINIGFAMEAENQKNLEVLTTCYNDDTTYDPTVNSIKPKGGGAKTALDSKSNRHWINGNTGAQLSTDDAGADDLALTFKGLMTAKRILLQTGLDVSNAKMYLDPAGIIQVVQDSAISTYIQRSVPEVVTEGYIEKLAGIDLIASSQTANGVQTDDNGIKRGVVFLPIVSFGAVTGRETQIDAERVARQQSIFLSASLKFGAFCKKVESTVRVSFDINA